MNDSFDELSRAVAGSVSRRRALKLMGGAVAGLGAAALGLAPRSAGAAAPECTCSTSAQGDLACFNSQGHVCPHASCTDPKAPCKGKAAGEACTC